MSLACACLKMREPSNSLPESMDVFFFWKTILANKQFGLFLAHPLGNRAKGWTFDSPSYRTKRLPYLELDPRACQRIWERETKSGPATIASVTHFSETKTTGTGRSHVLAFCFDTCGPPSEGECALFWGRRLDLPGSPEVRKFLRLP